MRYRVLGAVGAAADDGASVRLGGPRQRLVLALLLRDVGRPVADDGFIDALWPADPPAGARHTIQTYVSELRRVLDDEIQRVGNGYLLAVDRDAVDVCRFEALVEAARHRMADAPAGAAATLREALALWHGDPYADLQDALVLQDEIQRLHQARLDAVEDRIQADLEAGRHARVTVELESLARDHPYRERLHGMLMLALYRSGRQAEALRAYERARSVLAADLGIDPSPDLQRLQRHILDQEPSLLPAARDASGDDAPQVVRGFELRERIARRGPATVWRAYQASASREVAITVIAAHEANAPSFLRAFDPHARRLAELEHRHLQALLDHWRDPRGAYLVSPWVPGSTARTILEHGAWSASAALRLAEQVGAALTALHQIGLVHGDVAASTVLLDEEGDALLTVAGAIVRGAAASQHVAPEARRGQPAGASADVRGLATLVIEVLTGTEPTPERPLAPLELARLDLPSELVPVLRKATAADPASRHRRVEDLVRELRQALGADGVGLGGEASVHRVRNPYKGLRAFHESDAQDFHGREALVDELAAAVTDHRLVAVVGPSGSGKSSLVRAGLVPALRRADRPGGVGWLVTDLFPGTHPFEELEAALLRVAVDRPEGLLADLLADDRGILRAAKRVLPPDGTLLLVIDQFEELYSLTTDPDIRRLLLDGLVALAEDQRSGVRTVITLRADFFDRPLQHHAFGALVRSGLVPVGMPSPDELARAVSQPAGIVGVDYEPGLIELIVRDVADQPGGLPLLQHALTELFERRDGRLLTAEGYRAAGGVVGALGRRADELHRSLPPSARAVTEQVFLRLVTMDERGEDARRRVRRTELLGLEADPGAVETVIGVFGRHRLLSFDHDPITRSPTVEVAHEALFDAWGLLRRWIDSRREDLVLHRRLAAAVTEWQQAGEAPDYLLGGGRLEQLEQWASSSPLTLTTPERELLAASRSHHDELSSRRQRRRRAVVGALSAIALVAAALAGFALMQRERALAGERIALSRELAAASRLQQAVDHDLFVLLALEAVEAARGGGDRPFSDALGALHEAVLGHRLLGTVEAGGTLVAGAGPDGRVLVSGPPSNRAAVWDLNTGEVVTVLRDDGREPFQAASSADGRRAVETFVDAPTLVWDLEAGRLLRELPPTTPFQLWPSLSTDGRLLAVANLEQFGAGRDQTISLWDLDSGIERLRFAHTGNARNLAFSPDGRQLAVADMQNAVVRLYDTQTGEVLRVIGDPTDARGVDSVAFHPSGEQLAMFVFTPRELRIVDLSSEEVIRSVPLGTAALGGRLCYSDDGEALAVATQDDLLNVYDATGLARIELPGSGAIDSLVCGATGDRLVMATEEGVVRHWGLGAEHAAEVLSIAAPAPFTGMWSPAGDALLTTHHGRALVSDPDRPVTGTLHRYDPVSGRLLAEADGLHPFPPWWLAVSPDGRYIGTNANPFGDVDPSQAPVDLPRSARLVIHDAGTLEPIREIEGGGWPLGFDASSTRFLVGVAGGARIIDVKTGRVDAELAVPVTHAEEPPEVGGGAFLGDGGHVVLVGNQPSEGWIVDVRGNEVVATFCRAGGRGKAAVSADGRVLAVAAGGATELWDVDSLLRTGSGCEEGVGPVRTLDADASMGIAFDPQGTLLAAAGFDGVVTVWDADSGEQRLRLTHRGQVGGPSFSPDGRHLLMTVNDAGGAQHAVRVYTLDPDELVAIARERVTRTLTARECETFLPARCP